MSIKPVYWERILAGSKLFELRRRPPRVDSGDLVLVYASAPAKALVGAFRVNRLIAAQTDDLWSQHGATFGINRDAYFAYFSGTDVAWAIEVHRPVRLELVTLEDLRQSFPGFRPPQSYMYWPADRLAALAPASIVAL